MIYPIQSYDFIDALPLKLYLFGIDYLQPPINRPEGVPYYQWFYCSKGQGEVVLNRQRFLISPESGFFICSDDPHSYYGISDDWTLQIIGFDGPICSELLKILHMHQSGAYHFSNSAFFSKHLKEILSIFQKISYDPSTEYSKACYDFLLDISQNISKSHSVGSAHENSLIQTIVTYLEHHYPEPISLNELASIVDLSRDYMCALFKKHTGQTIIQYLLDIRIGHARHFLTLYPEKKALDIGKMCGFESPSYFGKVFKGKVGVSPEKYRRI